MPVLIMGIVCASNTFLVDGNTRRAADDLPLGGYKAAYHLLMLRGTFLLCQSAADSYVNVQGHIADKQSKRRRSGHRSSSGTYCLVSNFCSSRCTSRPDCNDCLGSL